MEDILADLNSFNVTGQPNSVHAEHPRFSQYKSKQSKSSQEARRKAVLAARVNARYDLLKHLRNVEEGDESVAEDATEQDEMEGIVECYQKPKLYKDFLMLSEWLVDVPEDFASQYFAVPCPVGKRCLVVAANGKTSMYARNGKCLERFYSVLPGGSPRTASKGYAMFDCIVCYEDNVFYILDMVAWMNQSIMQCETPFRFEWIRSRLEEAEHDPRQVSEDNDYKFTALKYHDCSPASLQAMMAGPFVFGEQEVDGLLFYHKESHYTHGQTPLIGWLKPFMMEEILGIPVPEHFHSLRPDKYTTLPEHIEYGRQAREQRLQRNQNIKEEKKAQRQKAHMQRKAEKKTTNSTMDIESEAAATDTTETADATDSTGAAWAPAETDSTGASAAWISTAMESTGAASDQQESNSIATEDQG